MLFIRRVRDEKVFAPSSSGIDFFLIYSPITAQEEDVLFETWMEAVIREEKSGSLRTGNFSFMTFVRYPAEERSWIPAENNTIYYRDLLVGGQVAITATRDGEMWHAIAELPDGTRVYWPDLVFYEEYEGEEDVFVSERGWKISGYKSIYMTWYTTVQGGPVGEWTMHFFHDRQLAFTREFTVLPQIPPGKVPLFNQGDYGDVKNEDHVMPPEPEDKEGQIFTIKQKGCAMTSCVMLLNYHGVEVDPVELNVWLKENKGYSGRDIVWYKAGVFAQKKGVNVKFRGTTGDLFKDISTYGPQIVSVKGRGHWVVVTGRDQDLTTYLINNPSGGVATTLKERYDNKYNQIRIYIGPEYEFSDDLSAIFITFHSPGELVLVDPYGRRTGFNPILQETYEEIPDSNYAVYPDEDCETGEILGEPIKN